MFISILYMFREAMYPIIRRINFINMTSDLCHSVQRRSLNQTCTPNDHVYRVTYTRYRIDTINSSDYGHMAARNV
jgi:hypothetical protein